MVKVKNIESSLDDNIQAEETQTGNYILVIEQQEETNYLILEQDFYSIGRDKRNSIVLRSPQVSRHHAVIYCQREGNDNQYYVVDGDLNGKKSFNGIYVNNKKTDRVELKHGDVIAIGSDIKMTFLLSYDLSELYQDFKNIQPLEEEGCGNNSTLIGEYIPMGKKVDQPSWEKLASILELCPNPIIEIDFQGNITYINPSANLKFKDIKKDPKSHIILYKLAEETDKFKGKLVKREIKVEKRFYEQYIHYVEEHQVIRSYIFDITERKKIEKNLQYQAFYDLLTNLPNRQFFYRTLQNAIANSARTNRQLAVLFLDLDRFKNINDSLGYNVGDQVLKECAKRLEDCLRDGDILCRWGEDKFTVLIPEVVNLSQLGKIAQRIIDKMHESIELEKTKLYLTVSIGIAVYPHDSQEVELLVKNANTASDKAKENGKNQYVFYSPKINFKSAFSLQLEQELHEAIREKQFYLVYQPQRDLKTGRIECFEALLRWNHPQKGVVTPDKFLDLAEETGLIIPLSEWILNQACSQNKLWQEMGLPPLRVGVNITPKLFQNVNFIDKIIKVTRANNLSPHLLELEITETTIIDHTDIVRQNFRELLRLGIRISLDDFGSGYSSLMYLKNFPFHGLKIDQSFIKELKDNQQDRAIISAIVTMAHGFNMNVIAEGVENEEQLRLLQELKCDRIQGYLISKPLSVQDVVAYIRDCQDELLIN
jgi:diguanylate cyclase (GGDEF)-like protein